MTDHHRPRRRSTEAPQEGAGSLMTDIVDDLHDAIAERQKVMKGGGGLYRRAADEIERLRDVNDQYAAVIEKAEDYVTRHYLDTRFGDEVLPMLATAPADALRVAKAEAWDEGYGPDESCGTPRSNPYRKDQS